MNSYTLPFTIRDAILCLVFLVCIIASIFVIMKKQKKVAMIVIGSFILLSIDPLSEFVIFNLISPNFSATIDFTIFNWAYAFISSFVDIVGFIGLMVAINLAVQTEQKATDTPSEEVVYAPNQ